MSPKRKPRVLVVDDEADIRSSLRRILEYDGYEGPEPIISEGTRRDEIYVGGLTYGAPLGFLLPFWARERALRDTLMTFNATYLNEQSTIENYEYDDLRFTVMVTKSFEF